MENRRIYVPAAVLLAPTHTPSAKVVWMALRLQPGARPAELSALTSLSRNTVSSCLSQLKEAHPTPAGPRVQVPSALLADRSVGARGKLLYGLLQTVPDVRGQEGRFTYPSLCALTGWPRNTLQRAIGELADARWIRITQTKRASPTHFKLGTPPQPRSLAEAAAARRRLKRANPRGEARMQEWLSALIASDQFTDNARPGFLVNPLTGQRLELDRFYPPSVAFEFHGAQHDHETTKFSKEKSDAQRLRDLIKAGLCVYHDIHLIIIRAEDLSLQGMLRKIGSALPLRDLTGHEPLINVLEDESMAYQASVKAAAPPDTARRD